MMLICDARRTRMFLQMIHEMYISEYLLEYYCAVFTTAPNPAIFEKWGVGFIPFYSRCVKRPTSLLWHVSIQRFKQKIIQKEP